MIKKNERTAILAQIRNPLIFFALALLLIETTHAIKEYLESPAFKDTVEDILYKRIKQECIRGDKTS